MKPGITLQLAVAVCTAGLLAGCTQAPVAKAPAAYRPAYIVSVPVTAEDTAQSLEARYGGQVAGLNVAAGYAVLGLDRAGAQAHNLSAQTGSRLGMAERNLDQFRAGNTALMGARRSIWMGGEWETWAGARRTIWMGGTYTPVEQNSGTFQQIRLERAHQLAPNLGAGVKVAVIDTGLDLSHPAFVGALAPSTEWKDFVGNDDLPQEEGTLGIGGYGHGTAVASIVLQVAPRATILPLRVLGPDGSGDTLQVANAIYHAAAVGARVINLSLGSAERSDVIEKAIKYATEKKNILVVASAGNEDLAAITYPAAQATDGAAGERSLSVGSVNPLDLKSDFSNYQKDKLELVAPGENVYAAGPEGLLVSWSGTSMAAPMVAGGLALAQGQTLAVSLKDVTKKMADNGQDLYNNGMNGAYKDKLGKGRLDLEKFLINVVRY
nr:S8 family serine peptidase [Deinococcus budaensis]